ncbi:MAG: DUF3426 domain-containing protein [Rhodoferax sp.]|nr:DUF3426 domain-containing protein [Rhodoferax sp.]
MTELPAVSFIPRVRSEAFWQRPVVLAVMLSLAGSLTLVLCLQVLLHERDRLSAVVPGLQTWLEGLCQPFGCRVEPMRDMDSVVIESSSFAQLGVRDYRLSIVLRNTSSRPVATPAMELTLLDAADRMLLRRVIAVSELAQVPDRLGGNAEWASTIDFEVDRDVVATVAGYRVVIFYP